MGQDTEGGEAEAGAAEEGPLEAEVTEVDRVELTRFDQGLPNRGQWRQGFAVADLDGDGHLDIAHGPVRKGGTAPVVFLGDSQGNWRPWRELRYQGPPLDYGDTAAADFDGDGHVDLAFAVHLRGILIALGDGEGGFKAWQTEGLEYRIPGEGQQPPPYTSRTVSVVDWNRDGRPDLLTLSEGPQMTRNRNLPRMEEGVWGAGLYLNRGDGHWAAQSGQTLPTLPFGDDLTVGDFDGDGLLDFATAMHVAGSKAILHLGEEEGGGFTQRVFEPLPLGLATAVEAADFDGDGRDDLAVGMTAATPGAEEAQNVVLVFLAREEGRWERRVLAAEADRLGVWSLGAGDLDGDGHTDLVALTGVGDRWLFLGTGDGGFQREDSPELASEAPGCRGYEAVLRDLNGDGRDEAILAFAGEEGLSDQLRPGERARQCPSGGSLEVWTLAESGAGE